MPKNLPNYGFPAQYNKNYLTVLIRDPYCVFAYWEFSEEQMDLVALEFGRPWGEVPLFLRVYDLTGLAFEGDNAHSFFDLGVHPLSNNYYIKDLKENRSYCIDLGLITAEGRFITLLRSNVVRTPRGSMADGSGAVWADLLDRLTEPTEKGEIEAESFSSQGVYVTTKASEDNNN